MGDWEFLVQATSGQAPLVWAKGIRGLSATLCLLHDLQVAGTDHSSHLRGQIEVCLGLHLHPQSLQGFAKKKFLF